jgi:hypothetical protein
MAFFAMECFMMPDFTQEEKVAICEALMLAMGISDAFEPNGWWDSAEVNFYLAPDYDNPVKIGRASGGGSFNGALSAAIEKATTDFPW